MRVDNNPDFQIIIDWFNQQGWSTKPSKVKKHFISRKGKHHTKIVWDGTGGLWTRAVLFRKTPNGGWARVTSAYDLAILIQKASKIAAPTLITKETLPEPAKLVGGPNFKCDKKWVNNLSQIRSLNMRGLVGLQEDGTLSKQEIFSPGEKVWFHFVGQLFYVGGVAFITDGDELYSVVTRRLYRKNSPSVYRSRVTSNMPEELRRLTDYDVSLIKTAIENYFSQED